MLRVSTAYVGSVSASLVRVGELFRGAVRLGARGVILDHIEPGGDPTPSPESDPGRIAQFPWIRASRLSEPADMAQTAK